MFHRHAPEGQAAVRGANGKPLDEVLPHAHHFRLDDLGTQHVVETPSRIDESADRAGDQPTGLGILRGDLVHAFADRIQLFFEQCQRTCQRDSFFRAGRTSPRDLGRQSAAGLRAFDQARQTKRRCVHQVVRIDVGIQRQVRSICGIDDQLDQFIQQYGVGRKVVARGAALAAGKRFPVLPDGRQCRVERQRLEGVGPRRGIGKAGIDPSPCVGDALAGYRFPEQCPISKAAVLAERIAQLDDRCDHLDAESFAAGEFQGGSVLVEEESVQHGDSRQEGCADHGNLARQRKSAEKPLGRLEECVHHDPFPSSIMQSLRRSKPFPAPASGARCRPR